jgi:predicted metal-binding membrane protein
VGLVDALLQTYRIRSAGAEDIQLAPTSERPMKLDNPASLHTLPRRDRIIASGLLLLVGALAWAFTVHQSIRMDEMDAAMWRDMNMSMNGMEPTWNAIDAVVLFVMWSAMMAAMMIPGASPMITAFATINHRRRARAAPYVPTTAFLLGYLIVWAGFSVMATALQWLLQKLGLLTTMMQSSSYYWSAALFGAAGLYQLSPLKETCLAYCRSPDAFVLTEWRDGALGAVVMGLRHGLFCMGCCAALMLLLFAVAVMDLRWVVALTVLVTSEKILPGAKVWRLAIAALLMAIAIGFALAGWRSA